MTWTKTVERDLRGRSVNVYTDEYGWRVVQMKRYAGNGEDQRRSSEPKVYYTIQDADGRQRVDTSRTVAGAKRAAERRREFDRRRRPR